jgi:hypothetical protein
MRKAPVFGRLLFFLFRPHARWINLKPSATVATINRYEDAV